MYTIIALYLYFYIRGVQENMHFTSKNYKGKWIDYHGWRVLEGVAIFIGLVFHDATALEIVAHSMIANYMYEMVLKGNVDTRTDRKTFKIFNYDLFYRWWYYPLVAGIGIIILIWS